MTVKEALDAAFTRRMGIVISRAQVLEWLNECEAAVQTEMLLLDRPRVKYEIGVDDDEPLLVPPPYDDMYVWFLLAEIDMSLHEMASYNDSTARYNERQAAAQKYILRRWDPKHNPVNVQRTGQIVERGKAAVISLFGLPVDGDDAVLCKLKLTHCTASTGTEYVVKGAGAVAGATYVGTTATLPLTAAQTFALARGGVKVGYTVTDGDSVTWIDTCATRLYMVGPQKTYAEVDQSS